MRVPSGGKLASAAVVRIVIQHEPDLLGRVKEPENVAPASSITTSHGRAALSAACRLPPAGTLIVLPVGAVWWVSRNLRGSSGSVGLDSGGRSGVSSLPAASVSLLHGASTIAIVRTNAWRRAATLRTSTAPSLRADDTGDRRIEAVDVASEVAPISASPLVRAAMREPEVAVVRCSEANIRDARGKEIPRRIEVCFGADDHVVCYHRGAKIVRDGVVPFALATAEDAVLTACKDVISYGYISFLECREHQRDIGGETSVVIEA